MLGLLLSHLVLSSLFKTLPTREIFLIALDKLGIFFCINRRQGIILVFSLFLFKMFNISLLDESSSESAFCFSELQEFEEFKLEIIELISVDSSESPKNSSNLLSKKKSSSKELELKNSSEENFFI